MIRRYGGTTADQGRFIRYNRFLNIPGPGTGHDGDSNISVEIRSEMQDAVAAFLQNSTDSDSPGDLSSSWEKVRRSLRVPGWNPGETRINT